LSQAQAPSGTAVAIDGLSFSYLPGKEVLSLSSLVIERGERVFLHGPSGSGKTTLLGLLAGILPVTQGRIQLLGSDFGAMPSAQRDRFRGAHIGYIFQMFNLIPYLSVTENIALPCRISPERLARLGGESVEAAAVRLAEGLGIGALVSVPVTELSVGQQQRVAAARALIGSPEIIIADEPTSALDADMREQFIRLLFAQAESSASTILFVSHDKALQPLFPRAIALAEVNQVGMRS